MLRHKRLGLESDGRSLNWLDSDLRKPAQRIEGERLLDIRQYGCLHTVLQNGGELRPPQKTCTSNVPQ
jgi:hypothetical protein